MVVHRSKLKPHPDNPRAIDDYAAKGLRQSIKDFGLVQPIVWNARSGYILGGHQRLDQADELKGTQDYSLTVAKVDLDEDDEKRLLLILNAQGVQGVWDIELFGSLAESMGLDGLKSAGFGITDLGQMYDDAGLGMPAWITGETPEQTAAADAAEDEINAFAAEVDEDKSRQKQETTTVKRAEKSAEEIQEFKDKKANFAEKQQFESQFNGHVMVMMPTNDSCAVFLEALGLPADAQWIDGVMLAERLDIDLKLEPVAEPKKKGRK